MRYKWEVSPKPTGRYSSFEHRGFPSAYYENGVAAAHMVCEDEYRPADVKIGKHKPIKLRIADHSITPWKWRTIIGEYKTVQDAKEAFVRVLKKYPHIMPMLKVSGLPEHLGF